MTTQLDLANAVTAAGGERLAGIVPGLDIERFLDERGDISQEKVVDLVTSLLSSQQQKKKPSGREAGLAEARRRFGVKPDTTTEATNNTVKTSKAREAGHAEARRRWPTGGTS